MSKFSHNRENCPAYYSLIEFMDSQLDHMEATRKVMRESPNVDPKMVQTNEGYLDILAITHMKVLRTLREQRNMYGKLADEYLRVSLENNQLREQVASHHRQLLPCHN
jgi:hypothetical protein